MTTEPAASRRPRRRRPRAGQQLRAELDRALEHASRELGHGQTLEWSEHELVALERAASAADRAEELGWIYDTELAGERRPTVLVKLSGEIRSCERQVIDLVSKVNPAVGPVKSERHQRAARSRWDRRPGA
jgi:hypothetical protein